MAFDCKKTMHFIAQKAHTPVQPLFDHVMKFVIIIDGHCIWRMNSHKNIKFIMISLSGCHLITFDFTTKW